MKTLAILLTLVVLAATFSNCFAQSPSGGIPPSEIFNGDAYIPGDRDVLVGDSLGFFHFIHIDSLVKDEPLTGITPSNDLEDEYRVVNCAPKDTSCTNCGELPLAILRKCGSSIATGVHFGANLTAGGTVNIGTNDAPFNHMYIRSITSFSGSARMSDKLEENPYGLQTIMQLRPVQFIRKGARKQNIGFIGEDIASLLPEITTKSQQGRIGINYESFVPILVTSIQELKQSEQKLSAQLAAKDKEIQALEKRLAAVEKAVKSKK